MSTLTTATAKFWTDEEGATMAEYALLLGLIAVFLVAAITAFRDAIVTKFGAATTALGTP